MFHAFSYIWLLHANCIRKQRNHSNSKLTSIIYATSIKSMQTKKMFQNKAVKADEFICIFYEYIFQQSRTKNIQIIWFICRIIFCICFLLPLFDPIGGCRRRYCNLIHWNVWFSNIFFLSFFPGSEHLLKRPACTRNAIIHARNFIPKQSIINLSTLNQSEHRRFNSSACNCKCFPISAINVLHTKKICWKTERQFNWSH